MSDPLEALIGKVIQQPAWAIVFAKDNDWVCSGVEFNREAAYEEMKSQRENLPALSFNIVPCTVLVGVRKPRDTRSKNGFSKGERVRLSDEGRKRVRPRCGDVLGTVVSAGRKEAFVSVRWDGQTQKSSQIYAVKFIEKVAP